MGCERMLNLNLEFIVLGIPALLFAITIHEFAHGYVAHRLGDPTPGAQGRLTLNPLAHLDPIGGLMLLLFRFGWAKPVPVNPLYFKDQRKGMILVAIAGPLANVSSAFVFYHLLRWVMPVFAGVPFSYGIQMFLLVNVQLNLGLAAFNLLPFPPLDGSKVVTGLLPPRLAYSYQRFSQYGPFVLMVLLFTGTFRVILNPIYNVLLLVISGFRF